VFEIDKLIMFRPQQHILQTEFEMSNFVNHTQKHVFLKRSMWSTIGIKKLYHSSSTRSWWDGIIEWWIVAYCWFPLLLSIGHLKVMWVCLIVRWHLLVY